MNGKKKFIGFHFKVITKDGHILPYRFYKPINQAPGNKYPLVLFLHGAGERGIDNRLQLSRFNPIAFWNKYPCFIIAPQCPDKEPGQPADKFAAAIPVCGGADLTFAAKFRNLPIWVFHEGADSVVLTKRSRDMVAAITATGGHPNYTEYPGVGHDAWGATYNNPEVWDWLFHQYRK